MDKNNQWANRIIAAQNAEGYWGYFHTLSEPKKYLLTTEQALRRLEILGYTIEDEPIQKAVHYMHQCLLGKKEIPDRREKLHNWDIFTQLMLSTWILRFTKECQEANAVSALWAQVIASAFQGGIYCHAAYCTAYQKAFGIAPAGGRLVDFTSFYQVSLVSHSLPAGVDSAVFDYLLHKKTGIYYIYSSSINQVPEIFSSKTASHYLAAIELLSRYQSNRHKLGFVVDWLNEHKNENGLWDMGKSVHDKVYFPYSDNWRKIAVREADCTYRIQKLLASITES